MQSSLWVLFGALFCAVSGHRYLFSNKTEVLFGPEEDGLFMWKPYGLSSVDKRGYLHLYVDSLPNEVAFFWLYCMDLQNRQESASLYLDFPEYRHLKQEDVAALVEYCARNNGKFKMQTIRKLGYFNVPYSKLTLREKTKYAFDIFNSPHFQHLIPIVFLDNLVYVDNFWVGAGADGSVYRVDGVLDRVYDIGQAKIMDSQSKDVELAFKKVNASNFMVDVMATGAEIPLLSELHLMWKFNEMLFTVDCHAMVMDRQKRIWGYLMEYARFGTLSKFLNEHRDVLDSGDGYFLHALHRLIVTIHYVHEAGFVHRDIKMANILVVAEDLANPGARGNYVFKLADFGISCPIEDAAAVGETGKVDQWHYIPIEWLNSEYAAYAHDVSGDWYEVGRMLEDMLTILNDSWYYSILLPLTSKLCIEDPKGDRFGFEQTNMYFTLLLGNDELSPISRGEIVSTLVIPKEHAINLKVLSNRPVSVAGMDQQCIYLFVRARLGEKYILGIQVDDATKGQQTIEFQSQAAHLVSLFRFKKTTSFEISSNMTFLCKTIMRKNRLLPIDDTWTPITLSWQQPGQEPQSRGNLNPSQMLAHLEELVQ